jgi:hypothetical protein
LLVIAHQQVLIVIAGCVNLKGVKKMDSNENVQKGLRVLHVVDEKITKV